MRLLRRAELTPSVARAIVRAGNDTRLGLRQRLPFQVKEEEENDVTFTTTHSLFLVVVWDCSGTFQILRTQG